jgi:RimJ/RimL family protein N-acetyltransferase
MNNECMCIEVDKEIQLLKIMPEHKEQYDKLIEKNRQRLFIHRAVHGNFGDIIRFGIWVAGVLVGGTSLRIEGYKGIIGYWIDSDFEGRGYITKSVKKLIEYAFLEEDCFEIEAMVYRNNKKSLKILQNSGFIRLSSSEYSDLIVCSIKNKYLNQYTAFI